MTIFYNMLTMFGGLALFLYGMRLMGDGLKESSSGSLKILMEKMTSSPIKAFLLGVLVTAIIQSSTATIVITSGLVGAGVIPLRNSLGIVIGANVGTTVTGQIIRLLDLNAESGSLMQLFKPSTLAPIALIIGILFIMFLKVKNAKVTGSIAIGFGILFTGLLTMTDSVSVLSDTGIFEVLLGSLSENPIIGYFSGALVAFILQSSSATIGILQAFSLTGQLTFGAIYSVLTGIYLGDCVTTAIVCSIGAKEDARRVGIVNILFNLSETILVLIVVTIVHKLGLLDNLWSRPLTSGGIANTNTVFNLGCAILLFPMLGVYEKLSKKLVKSKPTDASNGKYDGVITALNPNFFKTPALAFKASYDVLSAMFEASKSNISRAIQLLYTYDPAVFEDIQNEEASIDYLADCLSNYLVQFSPHVSQTEHIAIMDQYLKVITEFERLGDLGQNISEYANNLSEAKIGLSETCKKELKVLNELIDQILAETTLAFERRDVAEARHIEPLEEVVDDLISVLTENHLERLRTGDCDIYAGNHFLNLLSSLERISDVCSDVGIATIARVEPALAHEAHSFISSLHRGDDETYNKEYNDAHDRYFNMLADCFEI